MNNILMTLLVGTSLISLEAHAMIRSHGGSQEPARATRRLVGNEGSVDDGDAASVARSQAGVPGGGEVTDEQVEALYSGNGPFQEQARTEIRAKLEKLTPEARESVVELARSLHKEFQDMDAWEVGELIGAISEIADGDVCRDVVDFVPILLTGNSNKYYYIIINKVRKATELLSPLSKEDRRAVIKFTPRLFKEGLSPEVIDRLFSTAEVIEEIFNFVDASTDDTHPRKDHFSFLAYAFRDIHKTARKRVATLVPQIIAPESVDRALLSNANLSVLQCAQLDAIHALRDVPLAVIEPVTLAANRLSQDTKYLLQRNCFHHLVELAQETSTDSFNFIVNAAFQVFNARSFDTVYTYSEELAKFLRSFVRMPNETRERVAGVADKFLKEGMELYKVKDTIATLKELTCDDSEEGREGMLDAVVTVHSQILTAEADKGAIYKLLKVLANSRDCDAVHCVAQYAPRFISPELPDRIRVALVNMLVNLSDTPNLLELVAPKASPLILTLQAQDFLDDDPDGKQEENSVKLEDVVRKLEGIITSVQETLSRLPSDWTCRGYLAANPGLSNLFRRKGNEEKSKEEILLDHYLHWGQKGGLRYLPSDWTWEGYLAANPGLRNLFGREGNEGKSKEEILRHHYLNWGQKSGLLYNTIPL